MAIGMKDPVLGEVPMRALQHTIRNCPPPMEVAEGGHFVQEWVCRSPTRRCNGLDWGRRELSPGRPKMARSPRG